MQRPAMGLFASKQQDYEFVPSATDPDHGQRNPTAKDRMYMFGEEGSRIFCFNPEKHVVESVSVKGDKANLIKNYPGVVQRDPESIFVCGGINKKLEKISDQCLLFNPIARTIKELPPMNHIRYTFPLLYYNERLYALGGRIYGTDDQSLLARCEYFDFEKNSWVEMPEMKKKRCTSMAFIYRNMIWVFGGYTDYLKRSTAIEKYNISNETWEVVNFKLYQGMEAGHVCSFQSNKILIVGGKVHGGECSNVLEIDLHKETILNKKPLIYQRVLSKACVAKKEYLYVLGGNKDSPNCERYQFKTNQWKVVEVEGLNQIHIWKCFGYSAYTVVVPHEEEMQASLLVSPERCRNTSYLFGTDDEPFMLEIDQNTFETKVEGCPIELRLKNYQGACRVSDTQVFIGGGINRELKKIFNTCYMLDLQTKRVSKCENMSKFRYTFSVIHHQGYVYAVGGRQYGPDPEAVISCCEKMDVKTLTWQKIASLNEARCTSMLFVHRDKLYIAGGFYTNGERLRSFETYDPEKDVWLMLGNFRL